MSHEVTQFAAMLDQRCALAQAKQHANAAAREAGAHGGAAMEILVAAALEAVAADERPIKPNAVAEMVAAAVVVVAETATATAAVATITVTVVVGPVTVPLNSGIDSHVKNSNVFATRAIALATSTTLTRRILKCPLMDPLSVDLLRLSTSTPRLNSPLLAMQAQARLRVPRIRPHNPALSFAT